MLRVVVREADLGVDADAAAVVGLIDAYARDPMGGGAGLPQLVRCELVPALRAHPTALVLLACLDGEPVGVAVCFRGLSTFAARPLLNLHDLAVKPELRGAGIGFQLLGAVEERARALGCCKLTLEVRGDNRPAQGLYRKFGFTGASGVPGQSLGGHPDQTFFWEKRLA